MAAARLLLPEGSSCSHEKSDTQASISQSNGRHAVPNGRDEGSVEGSVEGSIEASIEAASPLPNPFISLNLGSEVQVASDIFHRESNVVAGDSVDESDRAFRERAGTRGPRNADWWSDTPSKRVRIRYGVTGAAAEPAITVVDMFKKTVEEYGDHMALAVKRLGEWRTWTYRMYYDEARIIARAFISLGLQPYHGVCVLGFNAPEWHLTNMATIMAGGQTVGIYLTSTPEACCSVATSSKADIIVVENDYQLQKVLLVRHKLPEVKAIVQYTRELVQKETDVYSWQELFSLGAEAEEMELDKRIGALRPDMSCAIIYTSGTSGSPKGVLLSHDNLTWVCKRVTDYVKCRQGEEHMISYLPLSHVASQLLDIYVTMLTAGTCWFAQPDALKGSLLQTLKEVHPTMFLGVPRVWEKIAESMQMMTRDIKGIRGKLLSWARGIGLKRNSSRQNGNSRTPFGWSIANLICFKKVRQNLGLDRCHFQMTGAAPANEDILAYFMSVDLPLYEMYGMSETSGPTTVTTMDHVRYCSVGRVFEGATLRISNPDSDGQGEVLIQGRHVFMGYNGLPELTRDVFTPDGFLKSGDIGYISEEGYLYITGRKKELLITASGEKIAPVPIENLIKQEVPVISNAMIVGDQEKFISCLLTLRVEHDDHTGLPTNQLTPMAVEACQRVGSSALTVADILRGDGDHKVLRMIQKGIDRVNKRANSKVQKIAKWSILEKDFSIAGGEITPTQKLKRSVITANNLDCIESFYSS